MADDRRAALRNAGIGFVLRSLHLPPRPTALENVRTPPMSRGEPSAAASDGVPDVSSPWGAPSSGAERLWSARDAGGLAPDGELEPDSRLVAELGYGLPAFGGRFTGTPNFGLGLSGSAGDYRLGWRLTTAAPGGPGLEVNRDATRRESANGDAQPEHAVRLRAALRW